MTNILNEPIRNGQPARFKNLITLPDYTHLNDGWDMLRKRTCGPTQRFKATCPTIVFIYTAQCGGVSENPQFYFAAIVRRMIVLKSSSHFVRPRVFRIDDASFVFVFRSNFGIIQLF